MLSKLKLLSDTLKVTDLTSSDSNNAIFMFLGVSDFLEAFSARQVQRPRRGRNSGGSGILPLCGNGATRSREIKAGEISRPHQTFGLHVGRLVRIFRGRVHLAIRDDGEEVDSRIPLEAIAKSRRISRVFARLLAQRPHEESTNFRADFPREFGRFCVLAHQPTSAVHVALFRMRRQREMCADALKRLQPRLILPLGGQHVRVAQFRGSRRRRVGPRTVLRGLRERRRHQLIRVVSL